MRGEGAQRVGWKTDREEAWRRNDGPSMKRPIGFGRCNRIGTVMVLLKWKAASVCAARNLTQTAVAALAVSVARSYTSIPPRDAAFHRTSLAAAESSSEARFGSCDDKMRTVVATEWERSLRRDSSSGPYREPLGTQRTLGVPTSSCRG